MQPAEEQIMSHEKQDYLPSDETITKYLPYVKSIVNSIASRLPSSFENDDLISAGNMGLIEAVERYDPLKGCKFMTYAYFRIRGAILSELRSQDLHSRSTRRKLRKYEKVYLRLERRSGSPVSNEEMAKELGISLDELDQIRAMSSISLLNFGEITFSSREDRDNIMGYFVNSDTNDAFIFTWRKEIEALISDGIEQLPEKAQLVISLYYWDELTMREISRVLGITESRVSQIHSQAIIQLRENLNEEKVMEC